MKFKIVIYSIKKSDLLLIKNNVHVSDFNIYCTERNRDILLLLLFANYLKRLQTIKHSDRGYLSMSLFTNSRGTINQC